MLLNIHPDAARRFDELAASLRAAVVQPTAKAEDSTDFPIDPHTVGVLNETNVRDVPHWGLLDRAGGEIARYTRVDDAVIGLEGQAYQDVLRLAERLHRTPELRDRASIAAILSLLFEWLTMRAHQRSEGVSATDYVLTRLSETIKKHTIIYPLYEVFVERPIAIGDVEIRVVDRSDIERWVQDWREDYPNEDDGIILAGREWKEFFKGGRPRCLQSQQSRIEQAKWRGRERKMLWPCCAFTASEW